MSGITLDSLTLQVARGNTRENRVRGETVPLEGDPAVSEGDRSRAFLLAQLALALGLFVALHWRLGALVVSEPDEGTYIYAGRLLAHDQLPYRDFAFAHPPGMPVIAALLWLAGGGSLLLIRSLFTVLWLSVLLPVARVAELCGISRWWAQACGAVTAVSALMLANMGRTVRLEPLILVFMLFGCAFWFARPRSRRDQFLAGACFAFSALIKLTAVVPIAVLVLTDMWWFSRRGTEPRRWLPFVIGAAVIAVPLLAACLSEPRFATWALQAQVVRPRDVASWRLAAIGISAVRAPVLVLGLLASVYQLVRRSQRVLFCLSASCLVTYLALAFAFKSIATYYFALCLPFCVIVGLSTLLELTKARGLRLPATAGLAVSVCCLVGAAGYSEIYFRRAHDHVSEPLAIAELLRARSGPIWTMVPDFALYVGRPLVPWYYAADSYLGRLRHRLSDEEVARSLDLADTAVLYPDELAQLPQAAAELQRGFELAHAGPAWHVWTRRRAPPAHPD